MTRRRKKKEDPGQAVVAMALVLALTGAASAMLDFVVRYWPLFALAASVAAVGLVLLLRHRLARKRAAAEWQRQLDAQVASTDGMPPRQFEELVARLLRRDGWQDVKVSGGAGDLGADVVARAADGRRLVVQCKRYAPHNQVSSPDMQRFLGTVWHEHGADLAWFVTTSGFTRPAAELGVRRGVVLIGRPELSAWMASSHHAGLGAAAG